MHYHCIIVFFVVMTSYSVVRAQDDVADAAMPESVAWLCQQVEWLWPSEVAPNPLSGRPVAVFVMYDDAASDTLIGRLKEQCTQMANVAVVCLWHSIARAERTRRMASLPSGWSHASVHHALLRAMIRSTISSPYVMLFGADGMLRWSGYPEANICDQVHAFISTGLVPVARPGTPTTEGCESASFLLKRSNPQGRDFEIGRTADDQFLWVRNSSETEAIKTFIEACTPRAAVHAILRDASGIDLDICIPEGSDTRAFRDSVLPMLDRELGTVTTIEPVSFVQGTLIIRDTALFARYRSTDSRHPTLQNLAHLWQTLRGVTTRVDNAEWAKERTAALIRWNHLDSALADMQRAGLSVEPRWTETERIVIRPETMSETEAVYLIDQTYAMPTMAASSYVGVSGLTYGLEAGIVAGRLTNGEGWYGTAGYRATLEVAAQDGEWCTGLSWGVEASSLFVLRFRFGLFTNLTSRMAFVVIPEIGLGYVGRLGVTIGGMLPVIGASPISSSVRCSLTYTLLPKGAR